MKERPRVAKFKKGELPPVGKPWKKGKSANPNGRPKIPDDVKAGRKLTDIEFERACGKILFMSVEKLEELIEDENTNVLEALVARILEKGIKESSRVELNYFIERFLGKVAENHNVQTNLNGDLTAWIAARKKAQESE